MTSSARRSAQPAHFGWRLLALVYDALPIVALWFVVSVAVLLLRGGSPVVPWTLAFWLQCAALWLVTGLYTVGSWRNGGQTMGMRPWRLRVVAESGEAANIGQLARRYAWATPSLLLAGLGLLLALFDAERRALHDRLSGTRMVRMEPPATGG
ncbi:RDD family protein [Pseudomarimonas arenosa]|uniref:RDD family protein n=1 Tax=Pseudomarimonas arenosa TaxID=2774145 RepID=A0AAW3ZKB3_9GAMM|nr:RDD family protein [Pseudomarimonas arenosa]MBD8525612.1 RDD family protein [Pseudomarimonas arenosa]